MEEREALLQQVSKLQKKAEKLRRSSHDKRPTTWDVDAVESQVDKSNTLYEELFDQVCQHFLEICRAAGRKN